MNRFIEELNIIGFDKFTAKVELEFKKIRNDLSIFNAEGKTIFLNENIKYSENFNYELMKMLNTEDISKDFARLRDDLKIEVFAI